MSTATATKVKGATLWPRTHPERDDMTAYHYAHEAEPVFEYRTDSYEAKIVTCPPGLGFGGAILSWTDYVTGEWGEWYATLALAVARLALLIEAVNEDQTADDDYVGRFFTEIPAGFADEATRLFESQLA